MKRFSVVNLLQLKLFKYEIKLKEIFHQSFKDELSWIEFNFKNQFLLETERDFNTKLVVYPLNKCFI